MRPPTSFRIAVHILEELFPSIHLTWPLLFHPRRTDQQRLWLAATRSFFSTGPPSFPTRPACNMPLGPAAISTPQPTPMGCISSVQIIPRRQSESGHGSVESHRRPDGSTQSPFRMRPGCRRLGGLAYRASRSIRGAEVILARELWWKAFWQGVWCGPMQVRSAATQHGRMHFFCTGRIHKLLPAFAECMAGNTIASSPPENFVMTVGMLHKRPRSVPQSNARARPLRSGLLNNCRSS